MSRTYRVENEMDLTLTDKEAHYLAWAEKVMNTSEKRLDTKALAEMGIRSEEIQYLQRLWNAYVQVCTPAGSCDEHLRYLIWKLDELPKQDKQAGCITVQSFLNSTKASYRKEDVKPEDYFLSLAYAVKHAEAGSYDDSVLCRIYKQVVGWCEKFAEAHGLKEKPAVIQEFVVEDEVPAQEFQRRLSLTGQASQADFLKCEKNKAKRTDMALDAFGGGNEPQEPEACGTGVDTESFPATERQKQFLAELVRRRGDVAMPDMNGLTKAEASRRISELLKKGHGEQ